MCRFTGAFRELLSEMLHWIVRTCPPDPSLAPSLSVLQRNREALHALLPSGAVTLVAPEAAHAEAKHFFGYRRLSLQVC